MDSSIAAKAKEVGGEQGGYCSVTLIRSHFSFIDCQKIPAAVLYFWIKKKYLEQHDSWSQGQTNKIIIIRII